MVQKEEAQIKTSQTPLKSCELQCVVSLTVHRPLSEIMSLSLLAHTLTSLLYSVMENRRRSRKHRSASAVKLKQTPAAAQFLWTPLIFHTQQNSLYIENKVSCGWGTEKPATSGRRFHLIPSEAAMPVLYNRSFETPVRDAVIKTENKINKMEPRASRLINPPAASLPVPFYFLFL